MILKSEAECITELGAVGKKAWNDGTLRLNILGRDYDIERPVEKLEPLSDEELCLLFKESRCTYPSGLRAIIRANDERNAQIAACETEDELVTSCTHFAVDINRSPHQQALAIIAKVRAHDRAKRVYVEPLSDMTDPCVECLALANCLEKDVDTSGRNLRPVIRDLRRIAELIEREREQVKRAIEDKEQRLRLDERAAERWVGDD